MLAAEFPYEHRGSSPIMLGMFSDTYELAARPNVTSF